MPIPSSGLPAGTPRASLLERAGRFSFRWRRARKELGLTQQRTAEFCGVSVTYLYQLEKGKVAIEFGKAIETGRRLGIDLFARRR